MQESEESLEAFHAALTAQAARSESGTLEGEIFLDLFISISAKLFTFCIHFLSQNVKPDASWD